MISILGTDDQQLQTIAAESSKKSKHVFGDFYEVFDQAMPKLKANEDLFIIANGSFKDEKGLSVIGDKQNEIFLSGVDAWDSFKDIFPKHYVGNIYVDVCGSAETDPYVFNFIENFWDQLKPTLADTSVFGRNGTSKGLIPLPTAKGWETIWAIDNSSDRSQVTNGQDRMGTFASTQFTALSKPIPNPHNMQASKYYVFNETGNIMMLSTDMDPSNLNVSVREVFNEVSVFWAAMTKAISATTNPATDMPFSIYNYEAIEKIISGCGHFVPVTRETVQFKTESCGDQWSKEMVGTVLGVPAGAGELNFAHAMMCSMGKAAWNMSRSNETNDAKVGNVVFVCEYLMGTPCVSAIVVHADMAENSRSVRMNPCAASSNVSTTWKLYKDKYMFVTPNFIKEYSGDLRAQTSSVEYNDLVSYISDLVTRQVHIDGITTLGLNSVRAPRTLMPNTEYLMRGDNFGEMEGSIRVGSYTASIKGWCNNTIKFVTPSERMSSAVQIELCMPGNMIDAVAFTSETYGIGSAKAPVFN